MNLNVCKGEFVSLLGASGCGKTTILRLISGFLNPEKGQILINGKVQNDVLPNKRKVGMVFQDYALFPHLTVQQNMHYGLKKNGFSKKNKEEAFQKVFEIAKNLGIDSLLDRLPFELSGGQQQRVALGRSLVLKPEILLMDEPLSSLDTNLRIHVRQELKEIQRSLKITTIYVTHDQEEALYLSDKIAVMNNGCIIQYDTPQQIYFEPENKFVAEYTGGANFVEINGNQYLVRPEWFSLELNAGELEGFVREIQFLGEKVRVIVENREKLFTVDLRCTDFIPAENQKVFLKIKKKSFIG